MYKKFYSKFLETNHDIQYYSLRGSHNWLDVTREATLQYNESERQSDVLSIKILGAQKEIAKLLNLCHPERIVFGQKPNELINQIIKNQARIKNKKTIRVLTSDAETFSFEDSDKLDFIVDKVATQPFDHFEKRLINQLLGQNKNEAYDIVYISHVFYNTGMVTKNLHEIAQAAYESETLLIVDGLYGFMAIPTDLGLFENKVFYLSGLNAYAQSGENCFFIACPEPIIVDTSLIDYSTLNRFESVLKLFKEISLSVEKIYNHIKFMQKNFRDHLLTCDHHFLSEKNILSVDYNFHGPFYTFALPSPDHAHKLQEQLKSINIITDIHENKLRFSFALFQNDCIDLTRLD